MESKAKAEKYYIETFESRVAFTKQKHLEEHGNLDSYDSINDDLTTDEVVGYYLTQYSNDALQVWGENIQHKQNKLTESDIAISNILKRFFKKDLTLN